jgi:16S rRNA (adenine1518-N6/adenine1519-N6)-dimethyltransferase
MTLPPLDVSSLLRSHNLRPKKSLGQNFLIDTTALQRIAAAAEITSQSVVLEVGPGLGSLTRYLAVTARHVTAVELDSSLFPVLAEVLKPFSNVRIVQGDILELNPTDLMAETGYLVVANIPYYITSAVIRHLLEAQQRPARMVLTVQKEVAERITAAPGDLSLLALSIQVYGAPRIVARIPAGAFYPAPDVDSAVVRIDLHPQPVIPIDRMDLFFRLIKAGFSQKRKTLRNSLSGGLGKTKEEVETILGESNIDPQRRAETVSMDEWSRLVEVMDRSKKN